MKKIAFLHGFLGSPEDMSPFFLENAECSSISYRDLLLEQDTVQKLSDRLKGFDVLVGYSFGGRLLGEVKRLSLLKNKTWIFVSSRHSPYTEEQLKERELFRGKIAYLIETDLQKFNDFWNSLPLFSGHLMSDYRERYSMAYKPWTEDEKFNYIDRFFNSEQFHPSEDRAVHYLHGEKDVKYSGEAELLKNVFNIYTLKRVGHRAPFEDEAQFKEILKNICEL